jgi:broad specificity phosphatase PhoE
MADLFKNKAQDVVRLILVRHGRTKKNAQSRIGIIDDTPLDEVGMEQARSAAERLMSFPITDIYSSPVKRAYQTAGFIADKASLDVKVHEALKEIDIGVISGKTLPEIEKELPQEYEKIINWITSQYSSQAVRPVYSGMEPIDHLEKRIQGFVDFVLDHYQGKTVCAVTHLAFIKGILATLFGRTVQNPMNFISFNTGITIIDFEKGVPILMRFNDCSHLDLDHVYGKITAL